MGKVHSDPPESYLPTIVPELQNRAVISVVVGDYHYGALTGTGELLTRTWPGRLRSFFAGQANAVLLAPRIRVLQRAALTVNDAHFRRVQARWLGLPPIARLAWAREPRVCQAVRAPGSKVTLAPATRAGAGALNSGSRRTRPVK